MTAEGGRVAPVVRIEASAGRIDWRELVAFRDLFGFLVSREIKVRHAQTVLGLGWIVIQPLFSVVIFTLVFGVLIKMPSDGAPYGLFAFAALVPWNYFSQALTRASDSLVAARAVISKVYYPRILVPLTPVVAQLLDFAVAFMLLLLLVAFYGLWPGTRLLLLPLLMLIMMLTAAGVGFWMSALAIQYRDVRNAMQLIVQLLMYLAPVIWPLSLLERQFGDGAQTVRLFYGLYPMAGVIEGFRAMLLGSRPIPWDLLALGALSATLLTATGLRFFASREPRFADVA